MGFIEIKSEKTKEDTGVIPLSNDDHLSKKDSSHFGNESAESIHSWEEDTRPMRVPRRSRKN